MTHDPREELLFYLDFMHHNTLLELSMARQARERCRSCDKRNEDDKCDISYAIKTNTYEVLSNMLNNIEKTIFLAKNRKFGEVKKEMTSQKGLMNVIIEQYLISIGLDG